MDPQQQFCLKWNSFGNNLVNTFDHLYQSASLTDVTLFCEGVTFQAHKLILAACSKHFQDLFESAPISPSILVILDGTSSRNMSALLEFMYKGEVHVAQDCLSSFLKAAEYLQVKGLSIEHERLVSQPAQSVESRIDSPVSRSSKSKIGSNNHDDGGLLTSGGSGRTSHTPESESMGRPPPSSTPSYSAAYPLSHYSKTMQHYEQHVPSPLSFQSLGTENYSSSSSSSRKRMHRSPSDQLRTDKQRPSVLRDGKAEYTSPMMYDPIPQAVPISTMTPPSDMPKQTAAVVENSSLSSPPSWHSNTNGAEDLRVKNEPTESGNSVDENGTKYYSMHGVENAQREREMADRIPPLPPLIPSPSGPPASSTPWKVEQPHRGIASTTTQDGKKLQCPYCERLYGYETNLRAHIRQRHQGIRVPCPFCSRTFTRNNTVRRHIAREHKTEIGIKPPNPPPPTHSQVQNHNQQP